MVRELSRAFRVAFVFTLLAAAAVRADQDSFSTTGNWTDSGSWSLGAPPTTTDDVLITNGGQLTQNVVGGVTVNSLTLFNITTGLTLQGNLAATNGITMELGAAYIDPGGFTLSGSSFNVDITSNSAIAALQTAAGTPSSGTIDAPISVNAGVQFNMNGTYTVNGSLTNNVSLGLVQENGTLTLNGTLNNAGPMSLSSVHVSGLVSNAGANAAMVASGSASFNAGFFNASGGLFQSQPAATVLITGSTSNDGFALVTQPTSLVGQRSEMDFTGTTTFNGSVSDTNGGYMRIGASVGALNPVVPPLVPTVPVKVPANDPGIPGPAAPSSSALAQINGSLNNLSGGLFTYNSTNTLDVTGGITNGGTSTAMGAIDSFTTVTLYSTAIFDGSLQSDQAITNQSNGILLLYGPANVGLINRPGGLPDAPANVTNESGASLTFQPPSSLSAFTITGALLNTDANSVVTLAGDTDIVGRATGGPLLTNVSGATLNYSAQVDVGLDGGVNQPTGNLNNNGGTVNGSGAGNLILHGGNQQNGDSTHPLSFINLGGSSQFTVGPTGSSTFTNYGTVTGVGGAPQLNAGIFNNLGALAVTGGNFTVNTAAVASSGQINLISGTLNPLNGVTNSGTINFTGGVLAGPLLLNLAGGVINSAGGSLNSSIVVNSAGALMSISPSGSLASLTVNSPTFIQNGTINLLNATIATGSGLNLINGGIISGLGQIAPGTQFINNSTGTVNVGNLGTAGTLTIAGASAPSNFGNMNVGDGSTLAISMGGATVTNNGTITLDTAPPMVPLGATFNATAVGAATPDLNNAGTISDSGTATITFAGTVNNSAAGLVNVANAGMLTLGGGTSNSNSGRITIGSASTLSATGGNLSNMTGGQITFGVAGAMGGTISGTAGVALNNAGTISGFGTIAFPIVPAVGSTGTGGVTNSGVLTATGGTININGITANDGIINILDNSGLNLLPTTGVAFMNRGAITLQSLGGGAALRGGNVLADSDSFTNARGATLTSTGAGNTINFYNSTAGPVPANSFTNNGTLAVNGGSLAINQNQAGAGGDKNKSPATNNGSIQVSAATLTFGGVNSTAGTVTNNGSVLLQASALNASGSFTSAADASVTAAGTSVFQTASLTNVGSVLADGASTVTTGNVTNSGTIGITNNSTLTVFSFTNTDGSTILSGASTGTDVGLFDNTGGSTTLNGIATTLTIGGNLTNGAAGSLTVQATAALTTNGAADINAGSITISGTGSTWTERGSFTNNAGGVPTVNGGATWTVADSFTNNAGGSATVTAPGSALTIAGVLTNNAGAAISVQSGATLTTSGFDINTGSVNVSGMGATWTEPGNLNNGGTITISSGGSVTTGALTNSVMGGPAGTVVVNGAASTLATDSITSAGNVTVEAGSTLNDTGGFTNRGTALIQDAGSVFNTGFVTNMTGGSVKVTGTASLTTGILTNAGTINLDQSGGTLKFGNSKSINTGTIEIDGPTSMLTDNPVGVLTLANNSGGLISMTSGGKASIGQLINTSGAALQMTGTGTTLTSPGGLQNSGTVNLLSGAAIAVGNSSYTNMAGATTLVASGSTITSANFFNNAGATLNVIDAGSKVTANVVINNAGTLNVDFGGAVDPPEIDNTGTVMIDAQSSVLGESYNQEQASALTTVDGQLTAPISLTGGTLTGAGTITGDIFNSGGVILAGDVVGTDITSKFLTMENGSYNQDGGISEFVLDSLSDFDQLDLAAGTVDLAGEVELEIDPGYTPQIGDTFDLILADGGVTDNTATLLQDTSFGNGHFEFVPSSSSLDAVEVEFVPEPTMLAPLMVTMAIFVRRRFKPVC